MSYEELLKKMEFLTATGMSNEQRARLVYSLVDNKIYSKYRVIRVTGNPYIFAYADAGKTIPPRQVAKLLLFIMEDNPVLFLELLRIFETNVERVAELLKEFKERANREVARNVNSGNTQ